MQIRIRKYRHTVLVGNVYMGYTLYSGFNFYDLVCVHTTLYGAYQEKYPSPFTGIP